MTDLEALALTIWGEARGEPIEGKLAVAAVIRNRVQRLPPTDRLNPGGYAIVCTAKAQFSAWTEEAKQMQAEQEMLEGDPTLARHPDPVLRLCVEIAAATIAGKLCDPTGGDLNYITRELYEKATPVWAKDRPIKQFGNQVFFTA